MSPRGVKVSESKSGSSGRFDLQWQAASVAGRLRDGEAVFQHLEADDFTVHDSEDDGEIGVDDLACRLEPRRERAENHGSSVVGENVADLMADALHHGARVGDEVQNCGLA